MTKPVLPHSKPIGQIRCPSPVCGKKGNLFQAKNGLVCFICPHCDDETLEPCYTKIFFGRNATKHLVKSYEDQVAEKEGKDDGKKYELYI